jgi:hypothetical protein
MRDGESRSDGQKLPENCIKVKMVYLVFHVLIELGQVLIAMLDQMAGLPPVLALTFLQFF